MNGRRNESPNSVILASENSMWSITDLNAEVNTEHQRRQDGGWHKIKYIPSRRAPSLAFLLFRTANLSHRSSWYSVLAYINVNTRLYTFASAKDLTWSLDASMVGISSSSTPSARSYACDKKYALAMEIKVRMHCRLAIATVAGGAYPLSSRSISINANQWADCCLKIGEQTFRPGIPGVGVSSSWSTIVKARCSHCIASPALDPSSVDSVKNDLPIW